MAGRRVPRRAGHCRWSGASTSARCCSVLSRVRVDRSPQLVTLVGVPGIGKSQLVAELGQAVAEDEEIIAWRYGRCLPYGEGVTFWALGEIVKAQCAASTRTTTRRSPRRSSTTRRRPDPEEERRWVLSSLELLVGLVPEDVALRDRTTELFAGWRIFLERWRSAGRSCS